LGAFVAAACVLVFVEGLTAPPLVVFGFGGGGGRAGGGGGGDGSLGGGSGAFEASAWVLLFVGELSVTSVTELVLAVVVAESVGRGGGAGTVSVLWLAAVVLRGKKKAVW